MALWSMLNMMTMNAKDRRFVTPTMVSMKAKNSVDTAMSRVIVPIMLILNFNRFIIHPFLRFKIFS